VSSLQAIEVSDVHKSFDGGVVRALNGVSVHIPKGEFLAITGPSGSGKSTLLHLIAALDRPTSGSILVDGEDLGRLRDLNSYRREKVGLVFQLHNLLPNLDALENVEVAMFGSHRSRKEQQARARRLLEEIGLADAEHRAPPKLSGGERQRVAIARALANDPAILLADEPTGNLDSKSGDALMEMLGELHAAGATLCLATHNPNYIARAQRHIYLFDGAVSPTPV